MDANRFDRISKLFAQRRALQAGTPEAADESSRAPKFLFVQTFRSGAITPTDGAEGRYTLSLDAGDGQTIYFSNRPDRLVGAEPTNEFIDHLGFPADNPPNAALIFEAEPGNIDVAVVELYAPVHDDVTGGMTYEVAPLGNWQAELGVELQEAPTDLAAVAPSFGAAHLFIDSAASGSGACPSHDLICYPVGTGDPRFSGNAVGSIPNADLGGWCPVPGSFRCEPCNSPASGGRWEDECDRRFPQGCKNGRSNGYDKAYGSCAYFPQCTSGNPYQSDCER